MRDRLFMIVLVLLAAGVFAGLASFLSWQQTRALAAVDEPPPADAAAAPAAAPRPLADTARLIRDLKLVTVEIRTTVDSQRTDQSWRGDVHATVSAPVRLLYGCDLSAVVADADSSAAAWLRPNLLTGGYTLRVPRPERIAAEIDGQAQHTDVRVGWGRFRDLAGEYHLGQARAGLHEAARRLEPTPAQRRQIEQMTREQLVALVRAISGESRITVEFFDPPGDHLANAPAPEPEDR
jgi:hypothetical protein